MGVGEDRRELSGRKGVGSRKGGGEVGREGVGSRKRYL